MDNVSNQAAKQPGFAAMSWGFAMIGSAMLAFVPWINALWFLGAGVIATLCMSPFDPNGSEGLLLLAAFSGLAIWWLIVACALRLMIKRAFVHRSRLIT